MKSAATGAIAVGRDRFGAPAGEPPHPSAWVSPPADYERLLTALRLEAASGNAIRAAAAAYLLGRPADVAFGTVTSFAAGAGISTSSAARCVTRLGFSGFRDLRDCLRLELRRRAAQRPPGGPGRADGE
ncbi:MAG: hypothetical protein KGI57_05060 [Hyphomicrobiales bacterium]|nr:hypothetical protein [Hyphomicrobiales bacterium]MDE2017057.1 hypothetical protein [Hyphomicrobiales bacterium]